VQIQLGSLHVVLPVGLQQASQPCLQWRLSICRVHTKWRLPGRDLGQAAGSTFTPHLPQTAAPPPPHALLLPDLLP
jgi:hypothetical protein